MDEYVTARLQRAENLRRPDAAAFCRALMQNPGILLVDEPVALLDLRKNTRSDRRMSRAKLANRHQRDGKPGLAELVREYRTWVIGIAKGKIILTTIPRSRIQDILHRLYGDEISQLHLICTHTGQNNNESTSLAQFVYPQRLQAL